MKLDPEIEQNRKPDYPINPLILNRWSPRSMTGEELSDEEIMPLFEAARFAPSSYNGQPWRFLYAKRNTPEWPLFFNLMVEFNQSWAKNASLLLLIISAKNFEHNNKPSQTHSFDTGAAWMSLALEASSRGLIAHGMEGFDYDLARKSLNVPDNYQVEAMAAIGKRALKETLPEDLQKKELPSPRKPTKEFIRMGKFIPS
ncbi:MAG: nitroreductase family protein [Chlamydiota bacterium]